MPWFQMEPKTDDFITYISYDCRLCFHAVMKFRVRFVFLENTNLFNNTVFNLSHWFLTFPCMTFNSSMNNLFTTLALNFVSALRF